MCQERQNLIKEISSLRSDFHLKGYPQGFIESVVNSKISRYYYYYYYYLFKLKMGFYPVAVVQ
jgi:hypothetical protein